MSSITAEFAFEIGDLVFFKGALHCDGHRPKQFCVYERIAQQCHGGIQMHYRLSGYTGDVPETVLTKDEPPYRPHSKEEVEHNLEVKAAMRAAADESFLREWKKFRPSDP